MPRSRRAATIDIGTNTILLLVADVDDQGKIVSVLHDEQTIVRLGQGVAKAKNFVTEAMERASVCLKSAALIAQKFGVKPASIYAVATSASRDAKNSASFFEQVRKETGIEVKIISGEQEALYSFTGGLLADQLPQQTALLDIGGGSTEFVYANEDGLIIGESIDMGAVRATELFLPGGEGSVADYQVLESELKKHWAGLSEAVKVQIAQREWTGVAGTITTLAGLSLGLKTFDAAKIHGTHLDRCTIADLYEALATQSVVTRSANPLIGAGRADVIASGAAILLTALEVFDRPSIRVSTRGLRYGALIHAQGQQV